MLNSEYWKLEKGIFAFFTSNRQIMKSIKRSYSSKFDVMGSYLKHGKLIGIQYRFKETELRRVKRYISNEIEKSNMIRS